MSPVGFSAESDVSAAPSYLVRRPRRCGLVRQRPRAFEPPPRTSSFAPPESACSSPLASGPRTSCLIGEALADDTRQQAACAILVVAAERHAVAVTEIK